MSMREEIKFVAISNGKLKGHWFPVEWMRDTRRGERAGGAVFRPTGELTTRHVLTNMKDPVTQDTIQIQLPQQAYVYREIVAEKTPDPRSRFLCPVCPAEELADGRFRNKVYTRDQLADHMDNHMKEDPEGTAFALEEAKLQGSTVEYASPTNFGGRDVEGVGHLMPGGGQVAAPPDPFESIAEAMGLTVEQVKAKLLQDDPKGAVNPEETKGEVAPGTEVPVETVTSGAESDSPEATGDAAPDAQDSGDDSDSSEGATETPAPATATE